ncbi:MAG: helix-turn-helix transcriptional regulator [Ruminococcaceae bacterium]|nr:helix-turn-helix transcriptional regulator [Oscillospiraceae bacterium]
MIELKLRALREDHDLAQATLAELLQVHQTTYSDYERGKLNVPLSVLDRLADYYGVSVDYLLGRTEIRTPYPVKKR